MGADLLSCCLVSVAIGPSGIQYFEATAVWLWGLPDRFGVTVPIAVTAEGTGMFGVSGRGFCRRYYSGFKGVTPNAQFLKVDMSARTCVFYDPAFPTGGFGCFAGITMGVHGIVFEVFSAVIACEQRISLRGGGWGDHSGGIIMSQCRNDISVLFGGTVCTKIKFITFCLTVRRKCGAPTPFVVGVSGNRFCI